jgi:hypothetical protein
VGLTVALCQGSRCGAGRRRSWGHVGVSSLRNVLAWAATHSRDPGLVERYLVNGTGFWVRTVEDKQTVEVILTFDSAYAKASGSASSTAFAPLRART